MQSFVISLMNKGLGYFGIAFLTALENIFPPIPSEVVLTLGGFMTSYTKMTLAGVIIFSTLGSLIGALLLYYLGYLLNERRLKKLVNNKLGRILCLKESDIDRAIKWFDIRGNRTVFFCRFVPMIRSLISIPAGTTKMNLKPFILFTTLGTLIWNSVLVILGRVLGNKWKLIIKFVKDYSFICGIIIGALFVIGIYTFIKNRKKENI